MQAALLYPSLVLLYVVGLGATRLLMAVLARGILHHRPPRGVLTYWRPATGYRLDDAGLRKQS